ncbi:MAG: MerR family transcriptional regulator [Corynebacteriales bacterium]|nr:MerR family transcriptional regulator [Mycobacteriales bacterium]
MRSQASLSIGEVLTQLRPDFPDTTISKLRFLESEGLVEPERTPTGYRKYSVEDVARLRYILTAQRDHYLPLKVIRENLDDIDKGAPTTRATVSLVPTPAQEDDHIPGAQDFVVTRVAATLTRTELLARAEVSEDELDHMEQFGLITPDSQGLFNEDSVIIATTVHALAQYGVEPRHLRAYKSAADREIGLFDQVLAPLARGRDPQASERVEQATAELSALSVRLHATLVRAGLRARS